MPPRGPWQAIPPEHPAVRNRRRHHRTPSDDDWMARAVDVAESVRGRTSPNPWVGAVVVPGPRPGRRRSPGHAVPPPHREGPMPRSPRWPPPAPGRSGGHALRHPRALRPPRPDPAVHRRHRGGRDPAGGGRRRGPRPAGQRGRDRRPPGVPASTSRWGRVPTRRRRAAGRLPQAPAHRAPVGRAQAGRVPRRRHRRSRTAPAGGSPARPPAAMPTASGPRPTR